MSRSDGREQPCSRGRSTTACEKSPYAQRGGHGLDDHRDDALGHHRLGRGRVGARPLVGDPRLHPGRHDPRPGGGDLPHGRQVRRRRPAPGWTATHSQDRRRAATPAGNDGRRRDNGDPQRPRARDVLAAEDGGFEPPTVEEFYPGPLFSFSVPGVEFEITRITWPRGSRPGVSLSSCRRAQAAIVPGKLQYLGESGYSLVRDGIARDVIGPKGLPFAPVPRRALLLHPREQPDEHHPVRPDLPDVEVRVPAGPRRHLLGASTTGSASASRASASTSRTIRFPPGVPEGRCTSW